VNPNRTSLKPVDVILKRVSASDSSTINEITKFATSNKYPSPFQSGAMFNVFEKTKGCKPIAIVAKNTDNKLLGSIVATTFMDAGIIIGKLVSHVTCRGGPLLSSDDENNFTARLLLKKLLEITKDESLYTRIYPFFDLPQQYSLLKNIGFKHEDWLNYLLDLTLDEEKIWDKVSKHRRKGIRKAEKLGLEMVDVSTNSNLQTTYDLLQESHKSAKIPLQDKSLFDTIYHYLVRHNFAKMVLAYRGEKPIASRVVLTFSGIIYDWYAGSASVEEGSNANEYLVWKIIQWGIQSGHTLFDFGGAGTPDEEYGPREFKRRFGGKMVNYGRYTIVHKPKILKLVENLYNVRRMV